MFEDGAAQRNATGARTDLLAKLWRVGHSTVVATVAVVILRRRPLVHNEPPWCTPIVWDHRRTVRREPDVDVDRLDSMMVCDGNASSSSIYRTFTQNT